MAVGVVIGAAVGMNVTTSVQDVPMMPLGKLTGGVDFGNPFINPGSESTPSLAAALEAGAAAYGYGVLDGTVVDLPIVAFTRFAFVKTMTGPETGEVPAAPDIRACPQYLRKLRSPPGAATSAHRSSTDVDTSA